MDLIFCLLLLVLGLLAAEDMIRAKVPATANSYGFLNSYAEYFGLAGIVVGLVWFIRAIALMIHMAALPIFWLLVIWAMAALMLTLGLIFGLKMLRMIIGEPAPAFIVKAEQIRLMLLPHRREIGLGAIVLSILFIL